MEQRVVTSLPYLEAFTPNAEVQETHVVVTGRGTSTSTDAGRCEVQR